MINVGARIDPKRPSKFAEEKFNEFIQTKKIEPHLVHPLRHWFDVESTKIFMQAAQASSTVKLYEEKMTKLVKNSIYLDASNFLSGHQNCLKDAYDYFPKTGRPAFDCGADAGIENVRLHLQKMNDTAGAQEQCMAEMALVIAINEYKKLMNSVLSKHILTQDQMTHLHGTVCGQIVTAFMDVPGFTFTPAWESAWQKLVDKLPTCFEAFGRQNRKRISTIITHRRITMATAEQMYEDSIKNFLQRTTSTQLDDKRVAYICEKAEREAEASFEEENTKFFGPKFVVSSNEQEQNFVKNWTTTLRKKFMEEKLTIFQNTQTCPITSTAEGDDGSKKSPTFSEKNDCGNQNGGEREKDFEQNFGLGLYLGPDIVLVGIYDPVVANQDGCPPSFNLSSVSKIPPYLGFHKDMIIYGEDALNLLHKTGDQNGGIFNVYDLLSKNVQTNINNTRWQSEAVKFFGENYNFKTEEIVALFLSRVKSDLESLLGRKIKNCVMTISPFLTVVTKIMLKISMTLAGFDETSSTLLHSTTAIGISYLLHSSLNPAPASAAPRDESARVTRSQKKNGSSSTGWQPQNGRPILMIHKSHNILDISVALIYPDYVKIKGVNGLPAIHASRLTTIWNALSRKEDTMAMIEAYGQLIQDSLSTANVTMSKIDRIIWVSDTNDGRESRIPESKWQVTMVTAGDLIKEKHTGKLDRWQEEDSILVGGAVLNAYQNLLKESAKIPALPSLRYEELSPYQLFVENFSSGKAQIVSELLIRNGTLHGETAIIPIPITSKQTKFQFMERVSKKTDPWPVGSFIVTNNNTTRAGFTLDGRDDCIRLEVGIEPDGRWTLKSVQVTQAGDQTVEAGDVKSYNIFMTPQDVTKAGQILTRILPPDKLSPSGLNEGQITMMMAEQEKFSRSIAAPGHVSPVVAGRDDVDGHGDERIVAAKSNLVSYVEVVQKKMADGTGKATSSGMLRLIQELLDEAQELVQRSSVSQGALEVHLKKLEKAAARIK